MQESLLSRVDWSHASRVARKQLKQRANYSPVVSAFRWWARRPPNVMGALLDAAIERYGEELTVADPFSGGGTVTFEAVRRGLRAYAQDLYPWPARGLATALRPADGYQLRVHAKALLHHLDPQRVDYHTQDGAELSHVLRVRRSRCDECKAYHHEFAHPLVSLGSRTANEPHAWFGCVACGTASRRRRDVASFACDECGMRWKLDQHRTECWECRSPKLSVAGWVPVLVQQLKRDHHGLWHSVLRNVQPGDPAEADVANAVPPALRQRIPAGKETNRLLQGGVSRWSDLYTQRQANVLLSAIDFLRNSDADVSVRDRLLLSVVGAAEMAGFLSRWDRFHLKTFEGMANHRYAVSTFSVETNLLSPIGRGTLPRRLATANTTLQWLIESSSTVKVVSTQPACRGRRPTDWDVLVATGSSAHQALRDQSVSVVITDPPYFEDVQYGELARLFHAWLKVYDPALAFDEKQEAVGNVPRGLDVKKYEETIAACLVESRRTLRQDGTLVLTFHNRRLVAWRALAGALVTAGFVVRSLAVVRSENSDDHCKRGVAAMLNDLVIECVKRPEGKSNRVRLQSSPRSLQEKNLAAMGLAMAQCVRMSDVNPLEKIYHRKLIRWTKSQRLIV